MEQLNDTVKQIKKVLKQVNGDFIRFPKKDSVTENDATITFEIANGNGATKTFELTIKLKK
ncbi:MAG: hypothetical protein QM737_02870 [Ferruginibacter sp.]